MMRPIWIKILGGFKNPVGITLQFTAGYKIRRVLNRYYKAFNIKGASLYFKYPYIRKVKYVSAKEIKF